MPRKPLVMLAVAVVFLIGLTVDLTWRFYTRPQYAVLVDHRLVGGVRQPEEAAKILQTLKAQITPDMQVYVKLDEQMTIQRLAANERVKTARPEEIQQALVATMPALTYATAIRVNGKDIVAVKDEATASSVRDSILDEYKQTVLRDAATVEQLKFQETIDWYRKLVRVENVRTVEEARNILKHGTDKLAQYIVRSGDTGWDIARSYNVTTQQLAEANPGVDIDSLQISQVLNVTFKDPYVHTQSISKRVVQEGIPFSENVVSDSTLWPWQYQVVTPGTWGTRELTIRETRENGQLIKTDVLSTKVLTNPTVQIAKQGTKQIPELGTGSLVYPVVGVTTSYFGPRWGSFHEGIDIGVPLGTPVLAADSGMVVFRGWSGNYGYLLKIDHGGGKKVTWYAHLDEFNVSLGDTVRKGQVVAYTGNTGFSTGPHLHYEVRVDGKAVDPLSFYK